MVGKAWKKGPFFTQKAKEPNKSSGQWKARGMLFLIVYARLSAGEALAKVAAIPFTFPSHVTHPFWLRTGCYPLNHTLLLCNYLALPLLFLSFFFQSSKLLQLSFPPTLVTPQLVFFPLFWSVSVSCLWWLGFNSYVLGHFPFLLWTVA